MRRRLPFLLAALVAAVLTVPASYAVMRGYDVLFRVEANPATVILAGPNAMFQRLVVGGYIAGMIAPLAYLAAQRDLARTMKALPGLALAVAILSALQGLALP